MTLNEARTLMHQSVASVQFGPVCGIPDPNSFTTEHLQTCIDALRDNRAARGI